MSHVMEYNMDGTESMESRESADASSSVLCRRKAGVRECLCTLRSSFPIPSSPEMFHVWSECFSRNMDTRPSFSLQFLVQFWKLHLIFYSNHLSIFIFFLFIGSSCLYTFLGYRVGLISGEIDNEIRFFIEHSSTMSRKFLQSFSGSRPWPVFADMSFKHGTRCGNIDHKVRLEVQKQQLSCYMLKVWKELSSSTTDGPLAKIFNVLHAEALHPWPQLLQGGKAGTVHSITPLSLPAVRGWGRDW